MKKTLIKVLPIAVMFLMLPWPIRAIIEDRPIHEIIAWICGVIGWFSVAMYEWGGWRAEDERR